MKDIINGIRNLSYEIYTMDGVAEKKGNPNFIEILNTYPEFVSAKNNYIASPRAKEETRGSKATIDYPVDILCLAHMVECMHIKNGNKFTSSDWEKTKRLINDGVSGEVDFFDPDKSRAWIDVFSALNSETELFEPHGEGEFINFFESYISLYGKMNTKKTVPFYSRWIREIAVMYTIYLGEPYDKFEKTAARLQSALQKGIEQKQKNQKKRLSCYDTDAVRNYMMTNIFMAHKKDKAKVLPLLCKYIISNPDEFVYEKGTSHRKRYRRYYCVIKELLNLTVNGFKFDFGNDELIAIFCNDNVDYSIKDDNIHLLESVLVNKIIDLSKNPDDKLNDFENAAWLSFLISEPKDVTIRKKINDTYHEDIRTYQLVFAGESIPVEKITQGEIVFEETVNQDMLKRERESVVDSVVKLLRLLVMLLIISKSAGDKKHEWEKSTSSDVIDGINSIMKGLGLLQLPTYSVSSFNEKSMMDFCVLKYIEENFS